MKVTFNIHYMTRWGESLTLVLGDRKYPMKWVSDGLWEVTVSTCASALKDYTYVVMEDGLIRRPEWEHHHCSEPSALIVDKWNDCPIPGCEFTRRHQAEKFDRPGFRGAGTAVPVFSLRSKDDFGIGDFRDLRLLTDWAARTGQCIIQLLPINDTTRQGGWDDSYPYSPVSSFALHPLYLRLQETGVPVDEEFLKIRDELNALEELDYPRVFKEKMRLLRKAFSICGQKDLKTRAFAKFKKENAFWLSEYASFCARRDSDNPEFYQWMQFHLDRQLSEEVEYARSKGISFKGDLPIGVSADSADAFWHPELFNLDSCAGAPPDFFSRDGQNWGFPTYNWDEMAKDDYAWWKARLRNMSRYFDAFRIDHILGFFRIWEIPSAFKGGVLGHFNPALSYYPSEIQELPLEGLFHEDPRSPGKYQPLISPDTSALDPQQKRRFDALHTDFFFHRNDSFWKRNAEKKLPELLGASGMLACGEDLGMVPHCVPGVMEHERILSLEMPCMDKGRPWPRLSVCTVSSHDMDTLRLQQPSDPEPWQCRRILSDVLSSVSMLAIFPVQDWLSLDFKLRKKDRKGERINEPADPHHHWRYRMHIDASQLLSDSASELNAQIEGLLKDSGRFQMAALQS